jgi:POTRA domain, FtsQ-type
MPVASRGRSLRPSIGGRRLPRLGRVVTPARAAGLLGMIGAGFLLTFVTGPNAFGLSRTEIPALTWTDGAAVSASLGLPEGENVFGLDTAPLEARLRALPGVASAEVAVRLPDASVVVTIEERRPVLAWEVRDSRFIADGSGAIFAEMDVETELPEGVAVVVDRRQSALSAYSVGARLDAVDLDVATRLGSLVPADLGSTAASLRVVVSDDDGFVLATPGGWIAVFGFYSPSTRPTSMVPGQVRLLRSLLTGREPDVRRIILASETDGTYVPRTTPGPTRR